MPKNKLFLLDAFALLYRAHFAFIKNPRRTKTGLNTSAVFGFTNYLIDIVTKEDPTHLGVALDTSAPTFRHIEYPEYKAQREETPEDLRTAVPYVYKMLKALNIPALKLDGFEADDIIGTISQQMPEEEFDVYMVTPDKDYAQLVKSNVFMYRPPGKFETGYSIYDREKIIEKYGLPPEQIIDYLGLMGDASDNIPGVPKIGEKTAIALLQEYGTMDNIFANVDKITKNSIRESLKENEEKGKLSKHLATIKCDVPLEYEVDKLKIGGVDLTELLEILEELEFKGIGKRLLNSRFNPMGPTAQTDLFGNSVAGYVPQNQPTTSLKTVPAAESPTLLDSNANIATNPHEYILLKDLAECAALAKEMEANGEFCFDTETTSLDTLVAELVGMSFCIEKGKAYFVLCPENKAETQAIVDIFKPIWANENLLKIGQNLKYDMEVLHKYGVEVKGKLFDTMLAHYVIKPEGKHGMDDMARNLLDYSPVSIETLIGKKGKGQLSMRQADTKGLTEYAAEDADVTFQLYLFLKEKVAGNFVFEEIEMPLVPVLTQMELEGIKLDNIALAEYSKELDIRLKALEKQILEISGYTFNVNSPAQLGEVLFEKMKLGKGKKTKTGQYSTDEEALTELASTSTHELPMIVLAYRGLKKLKSTYVDALPELINRQTGRVHTTFNQTVAVTGRLSSLNPNLQNIPIRSDDGKEVRKGFIARNEDFVILSADYSQVELRIMAAFSEDESMINAFRSKADIHRETAAKVFKVSQEEVTADMRSKAKMVNFGIIYGISAHGLAQRLRISRTEAKTIIDAYNEQYPKIKGFMDSIIASTREKGYVETSFGRRRYLPDIASQNHATRSIAERNAINSPIQGTAADIIKVAMIRIYKEMKKQNLQSKMLLQVHDELLFEVHKTEIEAMKTLIQDCMVHAANLAVPMEVEIGIGKNWLEAH